MAVVIAMAAKGWCAMALHNTSADAANTAVRAFLTRVGEFYLGATFNLGTDSGKRIWQDVRDNVFMGRCAYCCASGKPLQVEHLVMFNRAEFGLHHPGNIVPSCKECNNRSKRPDGTYMRWDEHLAEVCGHHDIPEAEAHSRRDRIMSHMSDGAYKLPTLSKTERHAIRVIAASLYQHVKLELDKSMSLYQDLHNAFVEAPASRTE